MTFFLILATRNPAILPPPKVKQQSIKQTKHSLTNRYAINKKPIPLTQQSILPKIHHQKQHTLAPQL